MKRSLRSLVGALALGLLALAVWDQLVRDPEYRDWHGSVFGIPYDFRPPTVGRFVSRWWAPDDPRLFTPHVFGIGWSVNACRAAQLARRFMRGLKLVRSGA